MSSGTESPISGHDFPFSHSTSKGTFKIELRQSSIGVNCYLSFDGLDLGWDFYPDTLIRRVRAGEFNDSLGFDASDAVPDAVADWNMSRW